MRGYRGKSRQPDEEIYKRYNDEHGMDAEVYKAICTLFEREYIEIFFEDSRHDEEKHHRRHIYHNAEMWAAAEYSHYIRKYPYKRKDCKIRADNFLFVDFDWHIVVYLRLRDEVFLLDCFIGAREKKYETVNNAHETRKNKKMPFQRDDE